MNQKTITGVAAHSTLRAEGGARPQQHLLVLGMLLGLCLFLGACAPTNSTPITLPVATKPADVMPSPMATMKPGSVPSSSVSSTPTGATVPATVIHADIVLTESQNQIPTTVKVGQIINVSDFPEFEWSVSYYDQVLLALTPPEKIKQPGASGWFFHAIAPGNTEIVLESIAPPCPAGTLCPPNIVRWVFPIQAVP